MTDYFALLDQPRSAWLDPEGLKQAFHSKSLRAHPDAQPRETDSSREAETAFARLNEAYQVLQDPKRRIHHLLGLEGHPLSSDDAIPREVEELFPVVAGTTQEADALADKAAGATNPLSRSLLKPELLHVQNRIEQTLQTLRRMNDEATAELRQLSAPRVEEGVDRQELHRLYLRFSYVTRWLADLEEKQLQLSGL